MRTDEVDSVFRLVDQVNDLKRQVRTYEQAFKEIEKLTLRLERTKGYQESEPREWLDPALWEIRETMRLAQQIARPNNSSAS